MNASGDELSSAGKVISIMLLLLIIFGGGGYAYYKGITVNDARNWVMSNTQSIVTRFRTNYTLRRTNTNATMASILNFVRFRESDDRVELAGLELGTTPHEELVPGPSTPPPGPSKPPRSLRGEGAPTSMLWTVLEEKDNVSFSAGSINSEMLGARDVGVEDDNVPHSSNDRDLLI